MVLLVLRLYNVCMLSLINLERKIKKYTYISGETGSMLGLCSENGGFLNESKRAKKISLTDCPYDDYLHHQYDAPIIVQLSDRRYPGGR